MNYKTKLLHSINVTKNGTNDDDSALGDLMANPEYLRHSSSIINEALKEGFDVLQLPNGDIVTTGTKTIVNTFTWDTSKNKLTKSRSTGDKPRARRKSKASEEA